MNAERRFLQAKVQNQHPQMSTLPHRKPRAQFLRSVNVQPLKSASNTPGCGDAIACSHHIIHFCKHPTQFVESLILDT